MIEILQFKKCKLFHLKNYCNISITLNFLDLKMLFSERSRHLSTFLYFTFFEKTDDFRVKCTFMNHQKNFKKIKKDVKSEINEKQKKMGTFIFNA